MSVLVDAHAGQAISVYIDQTGGFDVYGFLVTDIFMLMQAQEYVAMTTISEAISIINAERVDLVHYQTNFSQQPEIYISENVLAAKRRICDTNFAAETAELTRRQAVNRSTATILN